MMDSEHIGISTLTWVSRSLTEGIERTGELGFRWVDLGIIQNWSEFGVLDLCQDLKRYLVPIEKALERSEIHVASLNASLVEDAGALSLVEQARCLSGTAVRLTPRDRAIGSRVGWGRRPAKVVGGRWNVR